jgi:hypothetical protein
MSTILTTPGCNMAEPGRDNISSIILPIEVHSPRRSASLACKHALFFPVALTRAKDDSSLGSSHHDHVSRVIYLLSPTRNTAEGPRTHYDESWCLVMNECLQNICFTGTVHGIGEICSLISPTGCCLCLSIGEIIPSCSAIIYCTCVLRITSCRLKVQLIHIRYRRSSPGAFHHAGFNKWHGMMQA